MKWRGRKTSSRIEDRRGSSGRGVKGGLVGIVIAGVLWLVFDVNPMTALETGNRISANLPGSNTASPAEADRNSTFAGVVLADTEAVWSQVFAQSGSTYREPSMVLYRGQVRSACGSASSAMGPFYCPADEKIYLDLGFFAEMSSSLGISEDQSSAASDNRGQAGDFAQAYVIAHEVGHHIQHLTGVSDQVQQARSRLSQAQGNQLSVKLELQADCFAGVWANLNQQRVNFLEQGDVEEAISAASQIGDDTLQKRSQGTVVPDSFTHGTSRQRVDWFTRGFDSGNPDACDTFA